MDGLDALKGKYLEGISGAGDEAALEELRVAALGKKGEISLKMRELGQMDPAVRQVAGQALNALKDEIDAALRAKKSALADAALDERLKSEWLDVTLPGRPRRQGTIHPVSQVTEEITAIFADMGFAVAEGPQIESDWYNFDALNIAPEHPARQEHDTFFMARDPGDNRPPHVLRTHTSPVQIRAMQTHGAPIRVIAPGRVYRMDMDQTHAPMFHQLRGWRSIATSPWPTSNGCWRSSAAPSLRSTMWSSGSAPRISPSPNLRPRSISAVPGTRAS